MEQNNGGFVVDLDREISELTEIKTPPQLSTSLDGDDSRQRLNENQNTEYRKDFTGDEIPAEQAIINDEDDDCISGEEMEDFADVMTEGLDMLGQLGGSFGYERTSFTAEQRRDLSELLDETHYRSENHLQKTTATPYEKYLARRAKEMDDYNKKTLPMTPKEKKRFGRRFRKVLAQTNFKVSPGGALLASVIFYCVSRLIPILANLIEGRQSPPVAFSERAVKSNAA